MTTYHWYKSPVIWSAVLMFVAGGVQAVSTQLNPALLTAIMAVLALAASFFHLSLANKLGAVN